METIAPDVKDVIETTTIESETTYDERTTENERETEESTIMAQPELPPPAMVYASNSDTRASFSGLDYSRLDNVWVVNFNGRELKVLFPKTDDLKVIDGVLVNVGSNAISGVVLGNSLSLNTYMEQIYTVLPLNSSSAQNASYRYGAHGYLTTYSDGSGYNLTTTTNYGDVSVTSRGKFGSSWSSVQMIIIALLALQVLISFIGGLLKRG